VALDTFANLKTAIADTLNRTGLTNQIVDFITLLEAELKRHPAILDEREADLTLSTAVTTLPDDIREIVEIYWNDGTRTGAIDIVSSSIGSDMIGTLGETTGFPRKASVINDGTQLRTFPPPDQAYTVKLLYNADLTPLSDSDTSNWVLDQYPDVYLYGSCLHAAPFLKDDNRIEMWQGFKMSALQQIEEQNTRHKWPAQLRRRPRRPIG